MGSLPSPEYTIDQPLSDNLLLLRRVSDGTRYLGCILSPPPSTETISKLESVGAGEAVSNLLNHENLVNYQTTIINYPLSNNPQSGTTTTPVNIILWDYCDAGTLSSLLSSPPVPPTPTGFLPESLVWHVALGLLRALQWLHEGIREVYHVRGRVDGDKPYRARKIRQSTRPEADWWPVLHRDLRVENVFLQSVEGAGGGLETYGRVKLGGFGKAVVLGTVGFGLGDGDVPLVTTGVRGDGEDLGLQGVRERRRRWRRGEGRGMGKEERPYTQGSELFNLGAILYHMMSGTPLPSPDECDLCGCFHISTAAPTEQDTPVASDGTRPSGSKDCPHGCVHQDINIHTILDPLSKYTYGLRWLVTDLLNMHRLEKPHASRVLGKYWKAYVWWSRSSEDGRLCRDVYDDVWIRRLNWEKRNAVVREEAGPGGVEKKKGKEEVEKRRSERWAMSVVGNLKWPMSKEEEFRELYRAFGVPVVEEEAKEVGERDVVQEGGRDGGEGEDGGEKPWWEDGFNEEEEGEGGGGNRMDQDKEYVPRRGAEAEEDDVMGEDDDTGVIMDVLVV